MKNIAIIGLSCRFPGANTYQEFWQNLLRGANSVTEVPMARWNWQDVYGEPTESENKTNSKWGGFIEGADLFDAAFFGISPREAEQMDPQQRLALELAWQCIDNAGYIHDELSGRDIGVFVGVSTFDYKELQEKNCSIIEGHSATGIHNTVVPNRISYFFNFFGPSIAIDSACAGSLVSIHQAVNAINNGECEAALAGGVSLLATPTTFIRFSKVGMLSPTGSCKTFDENADGYVRGEGGGFIFLKPLEKAIEDKDHIWGVIKGSAVNHGGRTRSITAPSALSQSKVITAALNDAQTSPSTISFIEAHGTGTPLGDPIEILGLARAFNGVSKKEGTQLANNYCAISAVKTNIGHLEAAAGIAGCIKTLLALKHKTIPGNSNFETLNPRIKLEGTPFFILKEPKTWNRLKHTDGEEIPLRAGISSFGFGGVNCHLILEEAPPAKMANEENKKPTEPCPYLLCLSAHSQKQLEILKADYVDLLKRNNFLLSDLATTASTMQTTLRYRDAFVGKNTEELIENLSVKKSTSTAKTNPRNIQEPPKIGFMFTGQGSQHLGMGSELFEKIPSFRKYFMQCDAMFEPFIGVSIYALINGNNAARLNQTEFSQPAIFTLEYALAKTLMDIGITPQLMIGHSIGELVAACLANVITLNDAIQLIAYRAQLMGSINVAGGMLAIFQSSVTINKFIKENALNLEIAAINAPDSIVVSGQLDDIKKCKQLLDTNGIESKILNVSQAFHSLLMEPVQDAFYEKISNIKFTVPEIPIISNVTGELFTEQNCNAHYWVDHIRKAVNFSGGIECSKNFGVNVWIEIGATSVLCNLIKRHDHLDQVHTLPSLIQGTSELRNILNLIGSLFTASVPIASENLSKLNIFEKIKHQKPPLPIRKFDGLSYWVPQSNKTLQQNNVKSLLSTLDCKEILLGKRLRVAGKETTDAYFFSEYSIDELKFLADHRVLNKSVLPGAAFISMALSAAQEICNKSAISRNIAITDVAFLRPVIIRNTIGLQTLIRKSDDDGTYTFEIWSSVCDTDSEAENTSISAWQMNSKGIIHITDGLEIDQDKLIPLSQALTRSNDQTINANTFYKTIEKSGFTYGPAFQGIMFTRTEGNRSISKIKLSGAEQNKFDFIKIRTLDCIFQSALSLLSHNEESNSIPLPFEISKIAFDGEIPAEIQVVTEIIENENCYKFNLFILNETTKIIGTITGLTLKTILKSAMFERSNHINADIDYCFTQQLLEVDINDLKRKSTNDVTKQTLIFCNNDSHDLAIAIKEILHSNVIIVTADSKLMQQPTIDFYVESYTKDKLSAVINASMKIDSIYYMDGYVKDSNLLETISNTDFIKVTKRLGINNFIQLCQSLISFNLTDTEFLLKVITNKTMNVPQDSCLNPWGALVVGAAKVFAKEYPLISLVNLDIDDSPTQECPNFISGYSAQNILNQNKKNAEYLVNVGTPTKTSTEFAIRNNAIYQRSFHGIKFNDTSKILLKSEGVYLILGGAGGIGFSLSKYLATRFNAKIIWLGRRAANDEINIKIQEIESRGGSVLYLTANAAIAEDMNIAIDRAEKTYGMLNGVFHSALTLSDSSISLLTEEKLNSVIESKLEASINLFNAIKNVKLDFIAFFSSANSIVANKGQANYVAASAFKDAFGLALAKAQTIPIKIINWGYCGDVGVVASKQYRDRLLAQGIESIDEIECISIIKQSLSSPFTQIIPFKAHKNVYADIGFNPEIKECFSKAATQLAADWKNGYQYQAEPFSYDLDRFLESHTYLDKFSAKLILKTFNKILNSENSLPEDHAIGVLTNGTAHEKFVLSALDMLEAEGLLERSKNKIPNNQNLERERSGDSSFNHVVTLDYTSVNSLSWPDMQLEMSNMLANYPWLEPELAITWQCGSNLQKILSGEINSTEIIFPNMSMHLVEAVYKDGHLSKYFNAQTAEVVCNALQSMSKNITNEKIIRILEVGAGTGSTSHVVLEKIKLFLHQFPELRVEYLYTDISNAFLQYGRLHYEEIYPFTKFSLLDVGAHPATQDFEKTSFDIVIASNVLHATPDLKETLANIKWLMKKNAVIVLNELTQRKNYLTLTFGLLTGWWLSTDVKRRIANSPLLSPSAWNELLTECGFTAFNEHSVDPTIEQCKYQSVMSAQSNGYYFEKALSNDVAAAGNSSLETVEYSYVGAEDIAAIPSTASKPEMQELLIMYLRWQLVDVLRINIKSLFETRLHFQEMLLSELGMDSLTAMDLRNRIKKQLKIDVPVETLLGGGNVLAIIEHLYNQLLLQRLMSGNSTQSKENTNSTAPNNENIEEFLI